MKKNRYLYVIVVVLVVFIAVIASVQLEKSSTEREMEEIFSYTNDQQMYGVSAGHPEAVRVGMEIMEQGGNAVDAAIAVSYALGVAEPYASGIGGGGTMLIHPNLQSKPPTLFDYREVAPSTGKIPQNGVGVPGFVKGMEKLHLKFGSIPLERLIQPSIDLAFRGVAVTPMLHARLRDARYRMPVSNLPHLYPNGEPLNLTDTLVQKSLGHTLSKIKLHGVSAFCSGKVARDIEVAAKGVKEGDLRHYEVSEHLPIKVNYGKHILYTSPPPGGGLMLVQTLMLAEQEQVVSIPYSSFEHIYKMGQVNNIVNSIRKKQIGDPKFVPLDISRLSSPTYIAQLANKIRPSNTPKEEEWVDTEADREDHDNTTHLVVVDKKGMMVSATNTLSNFFGSGIYVDGFFLNNQLKNFSMYSSSPNKAQLGKKALSYTAPTIVEQAGHPIMGIGSSGGNRITFTLAEVIMRVLDYNLSMDKAINAPRYLVRGKKVLVENSLPKDVSEKLAQKGFEVQTYPVSLYFGGVNGIKVDVERHTLDGGYDRRRDGGFSFSR